MPLRPKELVGAVPGAGTSVLRIANEMDLFRQQPITPRRNSRTPLVGSGCACPEFLFARDHRRRPELPIEIEIGSTSIIPALIQDGEVLSRLRTLIPKSLRSHSHQLAQRSAAVPDPSTQVVGGEGSGTAAGGSAGDAKRCRAGTDPLTSTTCRNRIAKETASRIAEKFAELVATLLATRLAIRLAKVLVQAVSRKTDGPASKKACPMAP